jgi:hypothetical protein
MTKISAVLSGAVLALAMSAAPAFSHDFWINHGAYKSPGDGTHCCGNNDCFAIRDDDIQATAAGWLIKSLKETVPYSESQTSEDGAFWRCKRNDGSRRCFFAPQPSS